MEPIDQTEHQYEKTGKSLEQEPPVARPGGIGNLGTCDPINYLQDKNRITKDTFHIGC